MREEAREGNGQGKFRPLSLPRPHCPLWLPVTQPRGEEAETSLTQRPTYTWPGSRGGGEACECSSDTPRYHPGVPATAHTHPKISIRPWSRESMARGFWCEAKH